MKSGKIETIALRGRSLLMPWNSDAGSAGLGLYLFFQWMFCITIGLSYLETASAWVSWQGAAFALLALMGQTGAFVLIQAVAVLTFSSFKFPKTGRSILCATLTTPMLIFLLIDVKIYSLYRFHFNGFILNVLLTPGGLETVGLSALDKVLFISLIVVVFALALAFRLASLFAASRWPVLARTTNWSLIVGIIFCSITERALYAWADYHDRVQITRLLGMLPFYEPFSIRGNLEDAFGPAERARAASLSAYDNLTLEYPGPDFKRDPAHRFNVLVIAIESLRFDMLTPEVMPNLWAFSERGQRFERHHSGGNATRFGIFSLLYGTHGLHWNQFLTHRRGPALFSVLRNAGYQMAHFTSAAVDYPEFRQTVFVNDEDWLRDHPPGETPWERDVSTREDFLSFLNARKEWIDQPPFASFVFFDGPHAPYSFPPEQTVFKAQEELMPSYFDLLDRSKAQSAKAKYMNAVHFADTHLGAIFRTLDDLNLSQETIIFVTGDHGQEFWEFGTYGHNGAFNPMQAEVPFVMHAPGREPATYSHWTEHRDLVATLFETLGVARPWPTNGRSVFEPIDRGYAFICSFTECALRDEGGWVVFGTSEKKVLKLQYLNREYRPVDRSQGATTERLERLIEFFQTNPIDERFAQK